ncbi:MAG: peptide deformylase [Lentisphaerae bacterium GWF2_44_16]|nr:MAG: peptide deformylase [Lentisphaerae bacterium GWF2_44_16]
MPEQLEIAQLGNPVLRKRTEGIPVPLRSPHLHLMDNMLFTLKNVNGVGLAAPQVYVSDKLLIIAPAPNDRYPDAPNMDSIIMINPHLKWLSPETEDGWEGCLSIPGLRGIVQRALSVEVSYTDTSGKSNNIRLSGFPARVFQHEYDHLQGMLFIDRVKSTEYLATEKEYIRIVQS